MSPLRQRMVPIPAVRVPCPAAQRRGHGQRGRLLFGDFLSAGDRWRRKRQLTAPPGAHPGTRPWQRLAVSPAHRLQRALNSTAERSVSKRSSGKTAFWEPLAGSSRKPIWTFAQSQE